MDTKDLRPIWGGYQPARVLMTAVNLGMFEQMRAPITADKLSRKLKLDPRATAIVLDALAGMGLVKKKADKYENSADARRMLLPESSEYQGDIIRHADSLWQSWSNLDEVVRTGLPAQKPHDHRTFIMAMHNLAAGKADKVIEAVELKGVKTALDLGGGPGTYSMVLARRGVEATHFDLPETLLIARPFLRKMGAKGIKFISGDFQTTDIGSGYDLIFISQILHSLSAEDCHTLILKCSAALSPRGRIAIHEFPIDDTLTSPARSALFSVNMLVRTPEGRCYTPKELSGWLKDAGLGSIKVRHLDDTVLVMGTATR